MYVFTPLEIMLEVINVKKGFRMRAEELKEMFNNFPKDCLWSINFDEFFLSSLYVTNMDSLRSLRYAQAEKSYYIPTAAEVDEFFETGALLSDKAYQDMLSFLKKEMGLAHLEAENILFDLWEKVSGDNDPHGTMQWFWNKFEDALYQVKDCSKNIIDSYTQPFYGLVEFARREPETVRQMFIDLYSDVRMSTWEALQLSAPEISICVEMKNNKQIDKRRMLLLK